MRLWCIWALSPLLLACGPSNPPQWAEGGAALRIVPARWDRFDDDSVELHPNGDVTVAGELEFVIDAAGRALDADYEPLGLLFSDGNLVGPNHRDLGHVGLNNAAPPGGEAAWLTVKANGQVVYFDQDGDKTSGGRWIGCAGTAHRTCTFITHLFMLSEHRRRSHTGPSFGVGVGVGL